MTDRIFAAIAGVGIAALAMTPPVYAGPPTTPPRSCAPDAVLVGPTCVDKYEASVWLVPPTNSSDESNKRLINKIRKGKADLQGLMDGNATQLGCTAAPWSMTDYGVDFPENGNWTPDPASPVPPSPGVYAVSIPGVLPSTCITWFQAEQACELSGKRLLTNQEWQAAAQGTPDPGTDNNTTDCAVDTFVANTGARTSCVSVWGANDMVGNVYEWAADWGDRAGGCGWWWATYGVDATCLGESATSRLPGALRRGGGWNVGSDAGVFAINGIFGPHNSYNNLGFRCGR